MSSAIDHPDFTNGEHTSSPHADTDLVEYTFHVGHPSVTGEVVKQCESLLAEVKKEQVYQDNKQAADAFLTQQNLHRYLRARQFDLVKSKKLILESLTWRLSYKPESITAAHIESEANTGKIRVLKELDRHNRPIIVMDSSRENSKTHETQVKHLVWQLERAKRKMNQPIAGVEPAVPSPAPVEKYCLFINMERNSIWNSPPLKTSMETLKTLTERYPEHLGHAVVYKPGLLFAGLWAACKPVMDPKTVRKVIFIRGDVTDGSKNDTTLREIVGDNWRALCDRQKDDYDHKTFWEEVNQDEAAWHEKQRAIQSSAEVPVEPAAAAPVEVEKPVEVSA